MDTLIEFDIRNSVYASLATEWKLFLDEHLKSPTHLKVIFQDENPVIQDDQGRQFQIDFENDRENYDKKKGGMNAEPLSRALGAGKIGKSILDLSAGMGVDAVFLAQQGFQVTALERNPLIYLALSTALKNLKKDFKSNLNFIFADAQTYLDKYSGEFDVCYFDPMFPEKKKSALPKQEMVIFKNLVGADEDAAHVIEKILSKKQFKRSVVKRPLKADAFLRPSGAIYGKIIRYDIYGVL